MNRLAQIMTASLLILSTSAVVLAQDSITISSGSVKFEFASSLGPNVNVVNDAGDDPALEQPGGPRPPFLEFQIYGFTDQPVDALNWNARGYITVYRTADFAEYPYYQEEYDTLLSLLEAQPPQDDTLSADSNLAELLLPFLPANRVSSQFIQAQERYVDTGVLRGVRYLTVYRMDIAPLLAGDFIYTFQGLSADRSLYVSARLPVTAPGIPEELPADFDYEAFAASFDFGNQYMRDTIAALNAAVAADYAPALTTLDDIVTSITLEALG